MKKLLSIILTVCMILSVCATTAFAEDTIKITVDGKAVDCAAYGQEPTAINGTTLVPLRSVFEALGATVTWDGDTKTVISARGNDVIALQLDSVNMFVNGEVKVLSVPAQSMNERTMVPVRAIAEAFGCDVKWDGDTRTVIVLTGEGVALTPEAVVSKLYDAQMNLDFDTAKKCYKSEEIAAEYLGDFGIEDLVGYDSDERTAEILLNFTKAALKLGSYTIDEVSVDGNTAIVKATVTVPDASNVSTDSLSEELTMAIAMEALERIGLTLEDLENEEIVTDPVLETEYTYAIFEVSLEYALELIAEDVKNGKAIIENETTVLENIDDKWLISEQY